MQAMTRWMRNFSAKPLIVLSVILFLSAGSPVYSQEPAQSRADYQVEIKGLEEQELVKLLLAISSAKALQDTPPATVRMLRARAEDDLPIMRRALRNKGYIGAAIELEIDQTLSPIRVTYHVDPGEPFTLAEAVILSDDGSKNNVFPKPESLGLKTGERFRAESVLQAQRGLIAHLKNSGYPNPKVTKRRIVADHASRTVHVSWNIAPGALADFGETTIEGLKSIDEDVVRDKFTFKPGERYSETKLNDTKVALTKSGWFSLLELTAQPVDEQGRLPMVLRVRERAHRTIRLGVTYQTDVGPGGKAEWQHRNIFGRGEEFNISLSGDEQHKTAEAGYKQRDFFSSKETFYLNAKYSEENTDAYETQYGETSVAVEREFTDIVSGGAGVTYRLGRDVRNDTRFGLLSFPIYIKYDDTDDLLDPTEGSRVTIGFAPFFETLDRDLIFTQFRADLTHYISLAPRDRVILAMRGAWAAIQGASKSDVPDDVLFYAGGGGSVRGFRYQSAGEFAGNEPTGGLSLAEISGELRYRITDRFGLVAFLDGGRAFNQEYPDFSEELFWGAGLGFRYYTAIGPIRLDVATPLNPRDDDDGFQIYVSIGQAF
jgi:translocation and assembly module TamA